MSKATKRKSSSSGSKNKSASISSRDRKLSVFDRLGTKALPATSTRLCGHNIYHGFCPSCRAARSIQLASHSVSSSAKRSSSKKDSEGRPTGEGGSPEKEWSDWDQAELEYEDEKALEKRRQLLQRELELQMNSDTPAKHNNIKKRSSSSSSSSCSSSLSSSSSSNTSNKPSAIKIVPYSPDRDSPQTKLSKSGYKDSSPIRKGTMKKSPGRKIYKKSLSPSQAASSRKSPKRILARKKDSEMRDRSRQRSISRDRRRERSKDGRHRQRIPHMSSHSSQRGLDRKKDEERIRREDRRDRRYDGRDSRRDLSEEKRLREKFREKERCRQREETRRDKCGRGSRSSHQSRVKEQSGYSRHEPSRHSPISPSYHHHYRGERGGRYGSTERDRAYKELSPREPEARSMKFPHASSSSNYSESRIRRRGWDGGRYDSPKSTRDWETQPANERIQEWQRRSKHSQDKEFIEKDKDIDWKRSGGGRDPDDGVPSKRPRMDDPPLPPPMINEPDLSDISDDPDDILNRDDVEEIMEDSRGEGLDEVTDSIKEEESQPPLSTASSNLEHRLLDQRIGEDEGIDSLDFEEISDEELEEESKNIKGCDVLGVDWASFIAECRVEKKSTQNEATTGKPWDANNVLRRIGVSRAFAGDQLFDSVQKQLTQDGGEGLLSDIGGIQSAMLQRRKQLAAIESDKFAISACSDLSYRRHLCGLPAVKLHHYPLVQSQSV